MIRGRGEADKETEEERERRTDEGRGDISGRRRKLREMEKKNNDD